MAVFLLKDKKNIKRFEKILKEEGYDELKKAYEEGNTIRHKAVKDKQVCIFENDELRCFEWK